MHAIHLVVVSELPLHLNLSGEPLGELLLQPFGDETPCDVPALRMLGFVSSAVSCHPLH